MEMALDPPMPNGDSNPPHGRVPHLAESLKLEHQFLRVPIEHLKKMLRTNQRSAEKEISAVLASVSELRSREEAVQKLSSLVSRLQGLKRKVRPLGFSISSFSCTLWNYLEREAGVEREREAVVG